MTDISGPAFMKCPLALPRDEDISLRYRRLSSFIAILLSIKDEGASRVSFEVYTSSEGYTAKHI